MAVPELNMLNKLKDKKVGRVLADLGSQRADKEPKNEAAANSDVEFVSSAGARVLFRQSARQTTLEYFVDGVLRLSDIRYLDLEPPMNIRIRGVGMHDIGEDSGEMEGDHLGCPSGSTAKSVRALYRSVLRARSVRSCEAGG